MSNPTSLISRLLTDLKERTLKVGTLRGLYLIPLGLIGLWIVVTDFKYILQAIAGLLFVAAIVEGLYQLMHNPVKKQIALNKLVEARNLFDEEVQVAEKDMSGFIFHMKRLIEKKLGMSVMILPHRPQPMPAPPSSTPNTPTAPSPSATSTQTPPASGTPQTVQTVTSVSETVAASTTTTPGFPS